MGIEYRRIYMYAIESYRCESIAQFTTHKIKQ